ncbi:MAG: LCP family protein [Acidimicrobiales bacterium]
MSRGGRAQRAPRTWGQRTILLLTSALACALLVAAGGLGYAYAKYSRLARVELRSSLTGPASDASPQNFLLVGVDSAATLSADDPARTGRDDVGGLRSDTIMVLRTDPSAGRAALLSLPRDLWVPMAGGGRNRINTAIQIGGASELIDTIEEYLGIPINHYVQIDFAGFRDLVRVVDGVSVWFDEPARDRHSGLVVAQAGCVTLDPDQALAYVRARHYQTADRGRWRTDPTGDLGRIERQQDFIVRALRRAADLGIRNPVTLDRLVDAALKTVTVDDLLTGDQIVELARQFRGFDPTDLNLYALPVVNDTIGGAAVLRLLDDDAQPVLDLFRGTDHATLTPAAVRIRVLNGSGVPGEAGRAADALVAAGFTAAGTGEAETFAFSHTVVRYRPGGRSVASLVARYLSGPVELDEVTDSLGADVVVVTGDQFAGVRSTPLPATASTVEPAVIPSPPSSLPLVATTTSAPAGETEMEPQAAQC